LTPPEALPVYKKIMANSIDLSWQYEASCKNTSLNSYEAYYPTRGRTSEAKIKDLCNACPVKKECLDHALKYEEYGFWGGVSAKGRKRIRKELNIELIDINYESIMKYAKEREKIQKAIQAGKMKRGPKSKPKNIDNSLTFDPMLEYNDIDLTLNELEY